MIVFSELLFRVCYINDLKMKKKASFSSTQWGHFTWTLEQTFSMLGDGDAQHASRIGDFNSALEHHTTMKHLLILIKGSCTIFPFFFLS